MEQTQLRRIGDTTWTIAAAVLRDVSVRGKDREVILPMTAVRRRDTVLEPATKKPLDLIGNKEQPAAPQLAAGQACSNTAYFTRQALHSQPQQPGVDFERCREREVQPYALDAWRDPAETQTGTRSPSPATSPRRHRCGRRPRSGPTSRPWNARPRASSTRF